MVTTIDAAGRIVVPKRLREELHFRPGQELELNAVDGRLEMSLHSEPPAVIQGPYGPSFAQTGTPITDADLREVLEAVRERR